MLGDKIKQNPATSKATVSEDVNNVGLFPAKGKNQERLFPQNSSPKNESKSDEHLGQLNMDQSVEEINKEINEQRSTIEVGQDCQRVYRYDNYANKSDSSDNNQLTASQQMEAKLFLD